MRTTDHLPRKRIFPVLVTPIDFEMLSRLAIASGLSRGAVVRELILRETATKALAAGGDR